MIMSKSKAQFTRPLDTEHIKLWAKFMLSEDTPNDKKVINQLTDLAERNVNLSDITMLIKYYVDKKSGSKETQNEQLIKQIGALEYIIRKELGVSSEKMQAYQEEYEKAFDESAEVTKDIFTKVQEAEKELGRSLTKDEVRDIIEQSGVGFDE